MGNILFPCAPQKKKPESVINLSESCVERLIREEEESGKKSPAEELNIPEDISEKEWMMQLKCLDDAHSNTYGLTVQAFYKLADQVESQIEPVRPNVCATDEGGVKLTLKTLNKNQRGSGILQEKVWSSFIELIPVKVTTLYIIQCLQRNACCSIKCRRVINNFIDCVDSFRINIIKEQIECELKEKRKEDSDIVEEFLKNENGEF